MASIFSKGGTFDKSALPAAPAAQPSREQRIVIDSDSLDNVVFGNDAPVASETYDPAIHPTGNPWSGYWDVDGNWID